MNLKLTKYLGILLIFTVCAFIEIKAEGGEKKDTRNVSKVTGEPSYKKFNINNISTWVKNDGESDINPNGNSGFEFPKGSGKTAIFQAGFLWGGMVDGEIRVGGSVYRQGTVPGKILNSGVPADQLQAEDPNAANVRNYRVRRDISPNNPGVGDLSAEVADGEGTAAQIRQAYERDWNEWPAADGAPYEDVDGNGSYSPTVDIPGFPGADQTIWFVCNDTDEGQTDFMYGSESMGIEEQVTIWGYNRAGALGNMLFRSFKIINKSNTPITDMYVSMWNDPDLGNAADDFAGCDTTLSITYVYNATAADQQYGQYPAAAGFDFFQGPIVDSPGDSAVFEGKRVYDKRNLPMTAHYFFINSDPIYTDPTQGVYATGTLQWYNLLRGRVGTTGEVFPDPVTGGSSVFALYGDPLTGSGWVDGLQHPPGDRRAGMASGPFTMAPGDVQEIVVAEIAAGGTPPIDRLTAVSLLKFYDQQAQIVYDNFFVVPSPPPAPQVELIELDKKILLNWGNNIDPIQATESFFGSGYDFQGYNVYQLPSRGATISEARRIATFDKIDGIGQIVSIEFDPSIGVVGQEVTQFGTDQGIQRSIEISTDAFNSNLPLANGSRYYFAVTAYAYNGEPATALNVVENPIAIIEAIPQSTLPGIRLSGDTGELEANSVVHTGTSDASVRVTVVDPTKTTGHDYEVFFDEQHYYLDADGTWKMTNFPDSIGKPGDVSPSTMSGIGIYALNNTIDLNMMIDLVSPDFDYIDGVVLTFPPGIVINSAGSVEDCANDEHYDAVIDGQTISWGNNDTTGFGCFDGSQVLTVNVNSFTAPLTIQYVLYDDGYGTLEGDTLGIINAEGQFDITEFSNYFVTQEHWNLRDLNTGQVLLQDQTIINGQDLYAAEFGPGGSNPGGFLEVNEGANRIVDGLRIEVSGIYNTPIVFSNAELTTQADNTVLTTSTNAQVQPDPTIVLNNYNIFSGITTSWAAEAFGIGTENIDILQQDYELRFTGALEATTINGKTVYQVNAGGQMATVFSTSAGAGGLAYHPLNPNQGTGAPFLIRIPFEVWNVDDPANPFQVNLMLRDREQAAATADAVPDPYYAWNINNRVYAIIVNTPYDPATLIPSAPDPLNELATWVLVFYSTHYDVGDVIALQYDNPIQSGIDRYNFTAPAPVAFSEELAKEDIKRINVFPNPYYGVNSQEINKYQRFVTFNHLPAKATIRIFNLAGQLVRTIEKNAVGQYQRWDLLNDSGLPVASGLYIVYIDMPDLGKTKILKAAIIQEQQILDRF